MTEKKKIHELEKRILQLERENRRLHRELKSISGESNAIDFSTKSEGNPRGSMPFLIVVVDSKGTVLHVGNALAAICNLAAENILGKSIEDLGPLGSVLADSISNKNEDTDYVHECKDSDGSIHYLSTMVSPLHYQDQDAILVVSIDITDLYAKAESAVEGVELFRQMANSVPCALYHCAFDREWTMSFIGEQIHKICGYPPDDFIFNHKRSYDSVIHPEDRAMVSYEIDRSIEKGEVWVIEYRLLHKNGSVRFVHEEGRAIGDNGSISLFGFILDITEAKEMEMALKYSDDNMRTIMDASNNIIAIADEDGVVLEANSSFREQVMSSADEYSIKPDFIFQYENSRRKDLFKDIIEGRIDKTSFCILEDEKYGEVIFTAMPPKLDGKRTVGIFSRNIAEYRNLVLEHQWQSDFWYSLLDNANIWVEVLDEDANLVFLNKRAIEISGWEPETCFGNKKHWELCYPDAKYRERLLSEYLKRLEKGEDVKEFETLISTKDNGERTLSWSISFTEDWDGNRTGSLLVAEDITDRIKAEQERDETQSRFQLLAENSPDFIVLYSIAEKRVVYTNREEFMGWKSDTVITKMDMVRKVHPDDVFKLISATENIVKVKSTMETEFRVVDSKGDWEWISMRVSPMPESEGGKLAMLTLSVITERKRVEKELSFSEERLSMLIEASMDVMAIFDNQGRYTYHKGPEKYGIKSDKIIGKTPVEYIDCDHSHRRLEQILEVAREGIAASYENHWVFNGEDIWFHDELNPVYDGHGNVKAIVSIGRNITEIKKAQRKIEEKNRFLQHLLDYLPAMVFVKDIKGKFLLANPAFARFLGKDVEEVIGKYDHDLLDMDEADKYRQRDEICIQNPSLQSFVDEIKKDGQSMTLLTLKRHLEETGMGQPGILGISTDITELLEARKKLSDEKMRLASILESLDEGVVLVDSNNKIVYANHSFLKLTDEKLDLILNKTIEKVMRIAVKSGNREYVLTSTKGIRYNIIMTTERIHTTDGSSRVIVIRDITGELRDKERIERLERMDALGRLAAGVAHDLNNLLNGLVNYPELILLDIGDDHSAAEYARQIKNYGLTASAIVRNLLTMAREGSLEKKCLNTVDIVEKFMTSAPLQEIRNRYPNIRFEWTRGKTPLPISGNEHQLEMALLNLITNGAEAQADLIDIRTGLRYFEQTYYGYDTIKPGTYAVITIADTGSGIDREDMPHIFEPFYSRKQQDPTKGTGLGLALVWGTVKDHGGYIDLTSETGYTTFNIYIPIMETEVCEHEPKTEAQGHILVVDDMKSQLEIAQRFLGKYGYTMRKASTSREAFEAVARADFDLVLLDMQLAEELDGLDVFNGIRKMKPDQKIIFVTGYADNKRLKKALDNGALGFISKPYFLKELIARIKEAIQGESPDQAAN